MKKFGIVAIGYNRPRSMQRLLHALNEAAYPNGAELHLIISIDYSGDDATKKVAEEFDWQHGRKTVKAWPQNMGLRAHVLRCGAYMDEYDLDAVAVFEDDVTPSRSFLAYMTACVDAYAENPRVAGISLYTHRNNVHANMPFEPQPGAFDVYFMQFPQSWGQIWMRKQWNAFAAWYHSAENDHDFSRPEIPVSVAAWPKSSWLKYHIKYCIEKGLYFAYPYAAYSTCHAEAGVHYSDATARLQVPLQHAWKEQFCLPADIETAVRYDAYFERECSGELTLDLYGQKPPKAANTRYLASTRPLPFACSATYGLVLKPHEQNVLDKTPGNDILLYDLQTPAPLSETPRLLRHLSYYFCFHPQELGAHRKLAQAVCRYCRQQEKAARKPLWYRACRTLYRACFKAAGH